MRLTKLTVEKFKKVDKVELDLHPLNVIVGGNNSGKSSVLQGIHFSIIAAIASREAGRDTYTQDSLLFCPARNFEDLRHGSPYTNQANFGFLPHLRMTATRSMRYESIGHGTMAMLAACAGATQS